MTKFAKSRKATANTGKSTHAPKRRRATLSNPSTTTPRKSKLWNLRRIATLNYLFTTGRDKYNLTKQEIETLFNNLHDVTGERSGEMEYKTLQTQMNGKKRTDKALPMVWQQVLGTWQGPGDERSSLAVQKKEQVKLVIGAVKQLRGLEVADSDDSGDSDEENEVEEDGPVVEKEDGVMMGAQAEELEDDTIPTRDHESEKEEEEDFKDEEEAELKSTALPPSLYDLAKFLVHRQRPGRETGSDASNSHDPFALLDDILVSADECLLPVDEDSEAIRRDAGFYDTAENGDVEEDQDEKDGEREDELVDTAWVLARRYGSGRGEARKTIPQSVGRS